MDSSSGSDRPHSPEGTSTRPNPFDDADATARKRRRTGSPAGETRPQPGLVEAFTEEIDGLEDDGPADANHPKQTNTHNRRQSASKVTLNLRQTAISSLSSRSSSPERTPVQQHRDTALAAAPNAIHRSVEEASDGTQEGETEDTAIMITPSPDSQSSSPDVTPVHDEDGTRESDQIPSQNALRDLTIEPGAQIPDFPFSQVADSLDETLRQIANHVAGQTTFPVDVLEAVSSWLATVALLLQKKDGRAISHVNGNSKFWHDLPEFIHIITTQAATTTVLASTEPYEAINDFYRSVTVLTASLVKLDVEALRETSRQSDTSKTQLPDLFATEYLSQLHTILGFEYLASRHRDTPAIAEISRARHELAYNLLDIFRSGTAGAWEDLYRLTQAVADLLPTFPSLSTSLSPIAQVLEVLARHALRLERLEEQDDPREGPMESIHRHWRLLDVTLEETLEKRISSLNTERASAQLLSMRDTIRACLLVRPSFAAESIQDGFHQRMDLPLHLQAEILAWEWYFSRLGQLIRSSQMQLRVFAVTSMCTALVSTWRRFSEPGDEAEKKQVLQRVGHYLLRAKIVDYLFGPSCHPEIILESANIVGFLVINKQYSFEHTERLWQTVTTTQDPRIADALCRTVTGITNLFDYEGLLGFCTQLQTIPVSSFSPAIRDLWSAVIKNMTEKVQRGEAAMTFHPYQLCLQLLRDSSISTNGTQVLCPELQQTALQYLREVLDVGDEEVKQHCRQKLYVSCLEDLEAKSPTTLGSLWALSLAIRPTVVSEISNLTEQHGFTRLLVDELYHAVRRSRAATSGSILCGAQNLPRREFVAQIIQHQPLTLEGKLGTRLWDVLVGSHAACQADRNAGWEILNSSVQRLTLDNYYLSTCFTDRLPALPLECLSNGTLEFVRAEVLPLTRDIGGSFFEQDSLAGDVGVEQLWRIVTAAEDEKLAGFAIHTLAVDVFLESPLIQTFPVSRTRQIHSSVVKRCLHLLKSTASELRTIDSIDAEMEETSSTSTNTQEVVIQPQRRFLRAIQFLKLFLGRYRTNPGFALPDLRSLMPETPWEVEGDLTELKYQSFDGVVQTNVRPLNIGKLNTAASLLASLREETGFDNYRAYYRGRPFAPTEQDICKSLEDLQVREGLILVKKENLEMGSSSRVRAGSSPLEVEISSYFDELQSYLDLEEPLAREVLHLLCMLPADKVLMRSFEDSTKTHHDIFPPRHGLKTLYAVHTLLAYLDSVQKAASRRGNEPDFPRSTEAEAVRRCVSWLSDAISEESLALSELPKIRFETLTQLIRCFRQVVKVFTNVEALTEASFPVPSRLLDTIQAVRRKGESGQVPELAGQALAMIFQLGALNDAHWEKFRSEPEFSRMLQEILLCEPRQELRAMTAQLIEEAVMRGMHNQSTGDLTYDTKGKMTVFFWNCLSSLLADTEAYAERSHELFQTYKVLLGNMSQSSPEYHRKAIKETAREVAHVLLRHESAEDLGRPAAYDDFAHSLVTLLNLCVDSKNISATAEALPDQLATRLMARHLFPQERLSRDMPVQRVILSVDTRKKLCDIVFRLARNNKESLAAVLAELDALVPYLDENGDDIYQYDLPYGSFDREKFIRASAGYTGLRNLSNTCYLNSLVTQLSMNCRFRQFLLKRRGDLSKRDSGLLSATKRLLSNMQESWRPWVDPEEFVSTLKTFEETPIDVHSQMDVDEFYNLLFDQWEGEMSSAEDKRELRSFFGGQLVQQVKSKECDHISERLEPFSAIQCDIKGMGTLNASLQAYVDGEIMEGDNKYKCSTCDRHVDAVKRACLKDIPDNLIFHLKRFDFNLRTLQRSKINDYFSFPHKIDMAPYTVEHLTEPPRGGSDIFELVGVLVHSGTAESGHYYSYIKERPTSAGRSTWFEFNDEAVSQWDSEFLEHATFGGQDYRSPEDPNNYKPYSAYMLFYQRASTLRTDQEAMTSSGFIAPLRVDMEPNLRDLILDDNTMLLRRHCLFDPSHSVLVSECVAEARKAEDDSTERLRLPSTKGPSRHEASPDHTNHQLQARAIRVILAHLDQVVSRMSGLHFFPLYYEKLQDAIAHCTDCAEQVFLFFRKHPEAFRSLLQKNADANVRHYVGELFLQALRRLAEERPSTYRSAAVSTPSSPSIADVHSEYTNPVSDRASVPEGVAQILQHLWKGFHVSMRSWDEVFAFVHAFARLGHTEKAVLLSDDWLLKILRIIAADPSIETRPSYLRMLQILSRRARPPSYTSIISLVDFLLEAMEPVISADTIVEDASERLTISEPPFPWTSQEVNLFLHHPRMRNASLFVEKLIALDQSPLVVEQILCRLMEAGDVTNAAVCTTLLGNIPGDVASPLMNPFLRAAVCFVKNTEAVDLARKVVFHVSMQFKSLQLGEGLAFVDFFKSIMAGGFAQSASEKAIHDLALSNIPGWAPSLLISFEPITRHATTALLEEQLFGVESHLSDDMDMEQANRGNDDSALQSRIPAIVQELGVNCLVVLRDSHVAPQAPLSRDAAESIIRVISACRPYCDLEDEDSDMGHAEAYRTLYHEVLPALQSLIVEQLDADVSDWDGSQISSEGLEHVTRDITDIA